MTITFQLNGETRHYDGDAMAPLIDVLRRDGGLTGAKPVCREGFCGACTIHVDGAAKLACLIPVGLVAGCDLVTIEGLGGKEAQADGPFPDAFRQALIDVDAVQCGMCFPGMVMSLGPFLAANPDAGRDAVKTAMVGNICRCTGYERIVDAAMLCLQRMKGDAA